MLVGEISKNSEICKESISFFLLSFSLDEKETKNQGKKMLPRTWLRLARFFADPTHIANGKIII
ncbi:MAG: hypothetical protein ACOVSR_09275 [Bacteroidia bacterium]